MNNDTEQIFLLNPSDNQSTAESQKNIESTSNQVNLENVEDFTNVCRTCASITDFVIPIFMGEGLQNNLADKIHKHLPIQVSEEDLLPQVVCYQCASTLLAWHELVQCCVQADAALKTRLAVILAKDENTNNENHDDKNLEIETKGNVTINETLVESKAEHSNLNDTSQGDVQKNLPELSEKPLTIIDEDGKKYAQCGVCNRNVSFASYKRHMRGHLGEKRYSCHTCGAAFNESGNLVRHTRALHGNQRPFSCHVCDKSFTRSAHLQDHVKSHSSSRNYVCDVCGKASKSSAALRMHRKIHVVEYKFDCMQCGAKFKRRGELKAHLTVHTGEKEHSCWCGKSFRLRSQLTGHLKVHEDSVKKEQDNITFDHQISNVELQKCHEYKRSNDSSGIVLASRYLGLLTIYPNKP
ncbi:zinc finger protein 570-like isoform X4 [Battus philenor]|uniref:zinc finger protein 570-like isoform X4 n=1 Tax=Battus philenor TaxID=42288 RepID=UPI0035CF2B8A